MRKTKLFLTGLLLLFFLMSAFCAQAEYETLALGDKGDAVLALKARMYELGYFTSNNYSDEYNSVTVTRVKKLQKVNGLTQTGEASPELQTLIFSDDVLNAKGKRSGDTAAKATATPKPQKAVTVPTTSPETPERDEKGFLIDKEAEFVFSDADDGHWIYLSDTLQVEIRRIKDPNQPLVWFETDVKTAGDETMRSMLTQGKRVGISVKKPEYIARQNDAVVAFSDDFFGYRIRNSITVGVIVRDGVIYSDKTKKAGSNGMPNLETLAYFEDGSIKTYVSDAYTAQEYIDMGARHVFAFGPVLVRDGELTENMKKDNYYHYREPRCALGMIEPGHYVVLTVKGRVNESRGVYLPWLADKMLELGATEAINLDGGGTAALVFMGESLNAKNASARALTGLFGFGTSSLVPD